MFDFSDIAARLTARFRFSSEDVAANARLRELKSAYSTRRGGVDAVDRGIVDRDMRDGRREITARR